MFPLTTQGFLGEDLWLDLYKDIDTNTQAFEGQAYRHELLWKSWDITEEINRIFTVKNQQACLKSKMTFDEIESVMNGDLALLSSKIWDDCLDENWKISVLKLTEIQSGISQIVQTKNIEAIKKTSNIYRTARAGIYMNGDLADGPFDLIIDLQRIDDVVFWEIIEYDKTPLNHNKALEERQKSRIAAGERSQGWVVQGDLLQEHSGFPWICEVPGLSQNSLDTLFGQSSTLTNISAPTLENESQSSSITSDTSYVPHSDNAYWDCDGFFCIKSWQISYKDEAKSVWSTDSIQKVIATSTEHLTNFAHTSLLQSKMTTNFFEMGLLVKDLPSLLTMNFIITTKPAPILNLGDNDHLDKWSFSKDNLIEKYYASAGLEYQRRNSIENLDQSDAKIISLLNCAELPSDCYSDNLWEYQNRLDQRASEIATLEKSIQQVGFYNNANQFSQSFGELEAFVWQIQTYSAEVEKYAEQLSDTPQNP